MSKPLTDQIKDAAQSPPQQHHDVTDWTRTASTGSTLLDLAISGLKCRYGGLPGGKLIEISGPPGSAKTTIGAEIIGSVQRLGGEVQIKDPEARLDGDYCRKMGVRFDPKFYSQPDTVTDVIEDLIGPLETTSGKTRRNHDKAWRPNPSFVNTILVDSIASLSTRMEIEQGDKMGQRRAKELSEGGRLIARHIKHFNILMICTNQLRDNVDGGQFAPRKITPGGNAIPYYASVRIQLTITGKISKGTEANKEFIGKNIQAFVSKNSCDVEWRSAPIRLMFNYGIDDIGANLEWLKSHGQMEFNPNDPTKKAAGYVIGDRYWPANTPGGALEAAIKFVEDEGYEQEIKDLVVDTWHEIEAKRPQRKPKERR